MTRALADDIQAIWWITLGIGLVVAVVVVVLLQLLLNAVDKVERNVITLWDTATTLARNTATSWQLGSTGDQLDRIKAEALRHDALLSGGGDGRSAQPSAGGPVGGGTASDPEGGVP
ncbi:hypothetical protein [Haloechinothrix halophila]|uniref:hypothetical protein n=1 Tax=Haloechinothrix halophila TaxID=1069073 RepID=UPI00040503CB|nr:hypothetical protein [Haloechinothrix halophila]